MSFWVTLIAMARIPSTHIRACAHMAAVLVLFMVVLWKQHSYISYIIPIGVGVTITLGSYVCIGLSTNTYHNLCFIIVS